MIFFFYSLVFSDIHPHSAMLLYVLLLHSILLKRYYTIYFFILLLMDIWIVSIFTFANSTALNVLVLYHDTDVHDFQWDAYVCWS